MERPRWVRRIHTRLTFVLWYAAMTLPQFAIWEVAQLPLYTIWTEQGVASSLWAAACRVASRNFVTGVLARVVTGGATREHL